VHATCFVSVISPRACHVQRLLKALRRGKVLPQAAFACARVPRAAPSSTAEKAPPLLMLYAGKGM